MNHLNLKQKDKEAIRQQARDDKFSSHMYMNKAGLL